MLRAHAPGASFQSYVPDLPEPTAAILLERGIDRWEAASRRGLVAAGPPPSSIRLGLTVVDGHRIDAVLVRPDLDAVSLSFRDLEPEIIGSVTRLESGAPHFTPHRTHDTWATEPGRPERLVIAALEAYRNRPEHR